MHGGEPKQLEAKVLDMEERVARLQPGARFRYGAAAYAIVRDTEEEARAEVKRITTAQPGSRNFHSYQDFVRNSHLDSKVTLEDYSVSNRGLRVGLVGTPDVVARRLGELEDAGLDLVLLQMSPQLEEIRRFGEKVVPLL
jgi:FMNH2-dependent dimethyl sulfone monooxygenase